jgi:hypothetical protein
MPLFCFEARPGSERSAATGLRAIDMFTVHPPHSGLGIVGN